MAAEWTIERNARRGRHLVAMQRPAAGNIVLSQQPYAAVLYDEAQQELCDHTMRPAVELKRCAGCKLVWYSSRAAQKAAWPSHKQECAALARVAPNVPPPTVRLAARVLWRADREARDGSQPAAPAASGEPLGGGTFAEIEALEHHWDQLTDERKSSFAQMATLTRLYMYDSADADTSVSAKDIALLLARFACNNHTICDAELQSQGIGLYPTAAMVNHSCRPNAVQSFEGGTIVFRAVRPIQAGEEVTISYTSLLETRPERRAYLQRHYHFDIDAGADEPPSLVPVPVERLGSGAPPGKGVSVTERPPFPLDEVDLQLTALRQPGAFMLAEATELSDGRAAEGPSFEGVAPPVQHGSMCIRVRCWGPAFFRSGGAGEAEQSSEDGCSGSNGGGGGAQLAAACAAAAGRCFSGAHAAADHLQTGDAGGVASMVVDALEGSAKLLGPHHGLRLHLSDTLLRISIAGQLWHLAFGAARMLLPAYGIVYPQPWPDLGLLWAQTAKVAAVLERNEDAAAAAQEAARTLAITNGECGVVQEMLAMRRDIAASRRQA